VPSNISQYESYNGPSFGNLFFKKDMISDFADAMSRVHVYLETQMPTLFKPNPISLNVPPISPISNAQPVQPDQPVSNDKPVTNDKNVKNAKHV